MQTATYGEACTVAIGAVLLFLYSVYTYAVWSVYHQSAELLLEQLLET